MGKRWWLVICLILIGLVSGENLYQYDSLELQLDVDGKLNLVATGENANVKSVNVDLFLYPKESFRQKILNWESAGEVTDGRVIFEWKDGQLGEKRYGFESTIKTENKRIGINKKVAFPLSSVGGYEEYLLATEHIDKDYSKIVETATALVEGEDDLFEAVFKLAKWVEENIEYELTTLTTGTSQKASWVLENQQGVCDELSSLFIAMSRAVGIPARFVSGISYTENPEVIQVVGNNWAGHGWAEVYFPDYGWISFDITFGEYGYIDVTHIKFREGFDPAEASTKFSWMANDVDLETEPLNFEVNVNNKGAVIANEIILSKEVVGNEVDFGSYNLIKGIVENKNNYYVATTLRLTLPKEVEIIGRDKKIVSLEPNELKEVEWVVKVSKDLSKKYSYEFPFVIHSEKNVSVEGSFKGIDGGIFYSEKEIEDLMLKDDDKKTIEKISLNCDYEKRIKLGEKTGIACTIKNKGNMNLGDIEFCLGEFCKIIDLRINQEETLETWVEGNEIGWQKIAVSADNEEIEKKVVLEYAVLDEPVIVLNAEVPLLINYGEDFELSLRVSKGGFAVPKKVVVVLDSLGTKNRWEMEELSREQEFLLKMSSEGLSKENKFKVKLMWEDELGEEFEDEKIIMVKVVGNSWWEKVTMWFNGVVNLFF
ncbi:transglutaminase domain-containing protein [Candidatus Woesearchaeota archaeon]|nr:transglutaminase domain-containing protein [Candidatus Woesearchaeota archaeon]